MAIENIKVSTNQVNDAVKPNVRSNFDYNIPETIEEAQERYPKRNENGKIVDPVYDLFKGQLVVALQAPARKEIVAQWESLPIEERERLIQPPETEDGVHTAELPLEQQKMLQMRMDQWQLGEKSPRLVRVQSPQEALKYFVDNNKDLSDERRSEILQQLSQLLGVSNPGSPAAASRSRVSR